MMRHAFVGRPDGKIERCRTADDAVEIAVELDRHAEEAMVDRAIGRGRMAEMDAVGMPAPAGKVLQRLERNAERQFERLPRGEAIKDVGAEHRHLARILKRHVDDVVEQILVLDERQHDVAHRPAMLQQKADIAERGEVAVFGKQQAKAVAARHTHGFGDELNGAACRDARLGIGQVFGRDVGGAEQAIGIETEVHGNLDIVRQGYRADLRNESAIVFRLGARHDTPSTIRP